MPPAQMLINKSGKFFTLLLLVKGPHHVRPKQILFPSWLFIVRYSLSCSSYFCTLYVPTSTKNVRGGHKNPKVSKKAKICQKSQKKSQKSQNLPKSQHLPKNRKFPKTALFEASAAFATLTANLASLVCLIVLKNKAKNKS
jgi:hypothetical protein